MNSNQTVEKLRQMRLGAMAELHYQNVKAGLVLKMVYTFIFQI